MKAKHPFDVVVLVNFFALLLQAALLFWAICEGVHWLTLLTICLGMLLNVGLMFFFTLKS